MILVWHQTSGFQCFRATMRHIKVRQRGIKVPDQAVFALPNNVARGQHLKVLR